MADIRKLIAALAAQEDALRHTRFLAPCVRGGLVRVNVSGLILSFRPQPRSYEGWGIFQPLDEHTAEVVDQASLPLIAEYLKLLRPLRVRLAHCLQGQTWLAYPVNEADARQQHGRASELRVHLVDGGLRFDQIIARSDGHIWLFEDADRRADPHVAERLRQLLRQTVQPAHVAWKGITPEMRAAYALAAEYAPEFHAVRQQRVEEQRRQTEEKRLRDALRMGGGELIEYRDRGDYWQVEWETRHEERHTSAISKRDLTVISAGICLSDCDSDFDLQSLVGVVEQQWE